MLKECIGGDLFTLSAALKSNMKLVKDSVSNIALEMSS